MPIGKFKDFAALKGSIQAHSKKSIGDINAYTAAVARKMDPQFDEHAAAKKRENAIHQAAAERSHRRKRKR